MSSQALAVSPQFQSTPPMQGATTTEFGVNALPFSFNPRPLCRERPTSCTNGTRMQRFNPRPLCRERPSATYFACGTSRFNPRPLCRERRTSGITIRAITAFQSTPPMQGATEPGDQRGVRHTSFNPRPLCRERHNYRSAWANAAYGFNPRPLCRERRAIFLQCFPAELFQSTPPMQGATQ